MARILVISNYRKPITSRPEAEIFISLVKDYGMDVTVMTIGDSYYANKLRESGIRVIDFLPVKKFSKSEIRLIREELVKGKYDFVHLFNSPAMINGLIAVRGLSTKVIVYRGFTGNIHWYDPTNYFKVLSPGVDKIWCNSSSVKELIDKQLFFNKTKTVVITKGHDENWYSDIEKADLSEFGITKNDFVVITVANARRMKGLIYLLDAIEMMDNSINLKLLIMGGNDKFIEEYSKLLRKNKDKVIFTGFRYDNLSLVTASDVYMSSSIKGESFQKSVAEAMHLGICPVITTVPGNRGMVINNESGLIVPTKNASAIKEALLFLYLNRDKCREYGKNAREHIIRNFNFHDTVKIVMKMYDELSAGQ